MFVVCVVDLEPGLQPGLAPSHFDGGSALWTPADVRRTAQRAVLDALMLGNMQMLTAELTKCHRTPPPRRLGGDRRASVTTKTVISSLSIHNNSRCLSVCPPTRARALQQQPEFKKLQTKLLCFLFLLTLPRQSLLFAWLLGAPELLRDLKSLLMSN